MSLQSIKIYGQRNTGTNYLARLVALNLRGRVLRGVLPWRVNRWLGGNESARDLFFRLTLGRNLGWKHAVPPSPGDVRRLRKDADAILFLTLTKNPYAWLLSLHRHPYHASHAVGEFREFIDRPWPTVGRERRPGAFPSPMAMWNEKNAAYLALADGLACANLRYEDLLSSPGAVIEEISAGHGIERVQEAFRNVEESTKAGGTSFQDYRAYYLEERWRADLPQESIAAINAHLDTGLMQRIGYEVL